MIFRLLTQKFIQRPQHMSEDMMTLITRVITMRNTGVFSSRLRRAHTWPVSIGAADVTESRNSSFHTRSHTETESVPSRIHLRQCYHSHSVLDSQHGPANASTGAAAADTVAVHSSSSQRLWMPVVNCCQSFSTSARTENKQGLGISDQEKPENNTSHHTESGKDWALRFANENGYLSWCRNTYLTTVVSLALIEEGKTAFAEQAAKGALVVAALNLSWGTWQYVYAVGRLRHRTGMTPGTVRLHASLAVLHLVLWGMVCATFMGYAAGTTEVKAGERE